MPRVKLTERLIQAVKPEQAQRYEIWDSLVPGLALRVSATGKRSWCVVERRQCKVYRTTLGRYPNMSLQEAREAGRTHLSLTDKEFAERRDGEAEALTVEVLTTRFRVEYLPHNKSSANQWRYLERNFIPEFGPMDVRELEFRAIVKHLAKTSVAFGAHAAQNELKVVRRFLGWCVEQGYLDQNPAVGVKLRTPSQSRDRVLTPPEIRAVWAAADRMGYPFGTAVQMMLATGQRRTEVATMRWDDLAGGEWRLRGEGVKNGHTHYVRLSALAKRLLDQCLRANRGAYVFSTTLGARPISGFSKAKRKLDVPEAANEDENPALEAWRLHDLRRTVATGLARLRVPRDIISRCLNHSIPGVTSVYDRHGYVDEIAAALEAWARHLEAVVAPRGD